MELWTGIACLVADPKCKDFKRFGEDGKGAYVNIVAWASSEEAFRVLVKQRANELDCILLGLRRDKAARRSNGTARLRGRANYHACDRTTAA
jgi:hypothetical protein